MCAKTEAIDSEKTTSLSTSEENERMADEVNRNAESVEEDISVEPPMPNEFDELRQLVQENAKEDFLLE